MKKKGKKSKLEIGLNITSLVVFFGVWEIVAQMNKTYLWFNKNFLPGPSDVIRVAVEYIQNGSLWMHTSISISRILLGFAIGTVLAVIFGILFDCKGDGL